MKQVLPTLLSLCLVFSAGMLTAQDDSVVDIISGSDDHETLERLLTEANLVAALSAEGDTFTVFAPTDDAFGMLSEDDLEFLDDEDNIDSLTSVLTYHVIADSLGIDTFDTGMLYGTLNDGDSLFIGGYAMGMDMDMDTLMINGMMVEVTPIAATNGVVYSIDVILMQPAATVVDIIMNTDTLSTLEAAIDAADDDIAEALMGEGLFTVFAPSNDALAAIDADSLATLQTDGDLGVILQYHVVAGRYTSADLMDGMMLTTLQGEMVEVTISGDTVMVGNAMVIMADMIADNGVVHVIDSLLLPMAITSIDEPAFAREVSIFPNPATSQIYVNLPASILNNATLTLRDFNGRTIASRKATSDREPVEVAGLPAGTYLLEIRADAGVIQRKVMVQR